MIDSFYEQSVICRANGRNWIECGLVMTTMSEFSMTRMAGKTAIVTGGSRGMGEATVRAFVENGAKVVIADILEEEGESLAKELGDAVIFRKLDVRDKDNWDAVVAAANDLGKLQVLVNNAAIMEADNIMDMTEEKFMRIVSINQLGPFLGMQAVFPSLKDNGGGSIINISSIDGLVAKNGLIAYSGTKWAVRGMTKVAAIEMGKYGIRVNSVHPGGIYTHMHGKDFMTVEQANESYTELPIPRVGHPHEVAAVTLFLATDEASFSTGSEFKAEGGWSAGVKQSGLPDL